MTKIIWRLIELWIWKESIRWNWVVWDITHFIPKTEIDFDDKNENVIEEGSYWNIMDSSDSYLTKRWAEWGFGWNLFYNWIWVLLENLFWEELAVVDNWDWTFTHSFLMWNNNSHPSLVVWLKDPNVWNFFKLWMLDTFQLTLTAWEQAKFTASLKSKKWVTQAITSSYSEDIPLLWQNAFLKIWPPNDVSWTLLTDDIFIKTLNLTVNKNLENDFSVWDTEPVDFLNKQLDLNWQIEILYDWESFKNIVMNNLHRTMIFWVNTTIWWLEYLFTFYFPNVTFTNWERAKWNNDLVSQTLDFKIHLNVAELNDLKDTFLVILKNTTASY